MTCFTFVNLIASAGEWFARQTLNHERQPDGPGFKARWRIILPLMSVRSEYDTAKKITKSDRKTKLSPPLTRLCFWLFLFIYLSELLLKKVLADLDEISWKADFG